MKVKLTPKVIGILSVLGLIALLIFGPNTDTARFRSYFQGNLTDPLPPRELAQYDKGKLAYYEKDYATAYELLLPLAEQGYAEAQHKIGYIYSDGPAERRDLIKAQDWYLKSANQNLTGSMYNLGLIMISGDLSKTYTLQGLCWLMLGSELNNEQASLLFGKIVRMKILHDRFFIEARKLWEQGECSSTPLD